VRRSRGKKSRTRSAASYFSALRLKNFRGFKRAEGIRLAPLTFLVGPNSSGKSSIFDAFLFLAQSNADDVGDLPTPLWTGSLVDLGAFPDVVFGHRQNLRIGLGFDLTFDTRGYWRTFKTRNVVKTRIAYEIGSSTGSGDPVGRVKYMEIQDPDTGYSIEITPRSKRRSTVAAKLFGIRAVYDAKTKINRPTWYGLAYWLNEFINRQVLRKIRRPTSDQRKAIRVFRATLNSYPIRFFLEGTQRVASGRAAPKRWYPIAQPLAETSRFSGQYRLFDSVDPRLLGEERSREAQFHRSPRAHKTSLGRYLSKLDIAKRIRTSKLSPYHSSINVRDNKLGIESKLIDVGYGASQVIPVISACLSESPGPLFIEQPEIHLHPKAQAVIGELICRTSKHRQVIVETHSEHLINRARILIARGDLDYRDVIINYVSRTSKGSTVTSIPINKDGEFESPWPEGFFDERYRDTLQLLELTKQNP